MYLVNLGACSPKKLNLIKSVLTTIPTTGEKMKRVRGNATKMSPVIIALEPLVLAWKRKVLHA